MEENKERDYFLKIDGIDGESLDSKHPKEIRIEDFSFHVANRGRRGDYGVGRAVHDDARFFAFVDQSYPKLKQACAKGDTVQKAVLTCRKAGKNQQDYLQITLSNVLVTTCKLHTDDKLLPVMEFTLSFVREQIQYKEQKQDGTLSGAINGMADLRGNRSGT